jgi:hypothetical protein
VSITIISIFLSEFLLPTNLLAYDMYSLANHFAFCSLAQRWLVVKIWRRLPYVAWRMYRLSLLDDLPRSQLHCLELTNR